MLQLVDVASCPMAVHLWEHLSPASLYPLIGCRHQWDPPCTFFSQDWTAFSAFPCMFHAPALWPAWFLSIMGMWPTVWTRWGAVGVVCLEFGKAFDTFSHTPLYYQIGEILIKWKKRWAGKFTQVVRCAKSSWQPITSRVPQRSILFNIFSNDQSDQLECILQLDNIKLVGGAESICWMSGLLVRRTRTDWRNGLMATSWSSTKVRVRACCWDGIASCGSTSS